jgi:hypothetical protein
MMISAPAPVKQPGDDGPPVEEQQSDADQQREERHPERVVAEEPDSPAVRRPDT